MMTFGDFMADIAIACGVSICICLAVLMVALTVWLVRGGLNDL